MRVLMVSDVYFPRINGVSTSIETFRGGLAAEGSMSGWWCRPTVAKPARRHQACAGAARSR